MPKGTPARLTPPGEVALGLLSDLRALIHQKAGPDHSKPEFRNSA